MDEKAMDVDREEEKAGLDLIYQLNDNPPVKEAMFAALLLNVLLPGRKNKG
jgi:hypothetical protein